MTMTDSKRWTLADRLQRARMLAGLDQAQIAELLGVARTTVSTWERGLTEPSATHFVLWAEATHQPLEWLAEGVVRPEGFEPPTFCSVAAVRAPGGDDPRCFICGGGHDLDDCPQAGDLDDMALAA